MRGGRAYEGRAPVLRRTGWLVVAEARLFGDAGGVRIYWHRLEARAMRATIGNVYLERIG